MLTDIGIHNDFDSSDMKDQTIQVFAPQSGSDYTLNHQNTLDQKIELCSMDAKLDTGVQSNMLTDISKKKKNIFETRLAFSTIKRVSVTTNAPEISKKSISQELPNTKDSLFPVRQVTNTVLNQKLIKKDCLNLDNVNPKTTKSNEPLKSLEDRKLPLPLNNKRVDTEVVEKGPLNKKKKSVLSKCVLPSQSKHRSPCRTLDARCSGNCIAKRSSKAVNINCVNCGYSASQNLSGEVLDKKLIPDSYKKVNTRKYTHLIEDSDRKAEKMKFLTLKEKEKKKAIGSLSNYCSFIKMKTSIRKLPSLESIKRDPSRLYNEETLKEKKKKQLLQKFEIDLKRENEAIKECTFQPNMKKKKYPTFTQRHTPFIQGTDRFLQKQMVARKMQQSSMEREIKLFGSSTRECLV